MSALGQKQTWRHLFHACPLDPRKRTSGGYTVVGFLSHPGAVGALHLARKEGKTSSMSARSARGLAARLRQTSGVCWTRSSFTKHRSPNPCA